MFAAHKMNMIKIAISHSGSEVLGKGQPRPCLGPSLLSIYWCIAYLCAVVITASMYLTLRLGWVALAMP